MVIKALIVTGWAPKWRLHLDRARRRSDPAAAGLRQRGTRVSMYYTSSDASG